MIQHVGETNPIWENTKVLKTVKQLRLEYLNWMNNVEVGWDVKQDVITVWPFTDFLANKTIIVYKATENIYVPFYYKDFKVVLKTYEGKLQ